jgi:prepilin-type N-terminal cleavage/methylation domain-containing protein
MHRARRSLCRGFTIIELLAVLVILAVLSTLAISKFGESKRRAYIAAMKADLHNIAMIAETRFASENSYENIAPPPGSAGITLTFAGTANGWTATATHVGLPGYSCAISSGGGANSEPLCQ